MKRTNPYDSFPRGELILRDLLAIDRTILANERTFLAYIRTALTLLVAGVSILKFLPSFKMNILAWIFILAGMGSLACGLWRYIRMHHIIGAVRKRAHPDREGSR
jgi:putative membrane protein